MSFMYVNPGYKGLFDIVDNTAVESTNAVFNPNNKIAFYSSAVMSILNIPNLSEIWIKFNIYIDQLNSSLSICKISSSSANIALNRGADTDSVVVTGTNLTQSANISLSSGSITTFIMHVKTGTLFELYVNNILLYSSNANVLNNQLITNIAINSSNYYFGGLTHYNYLSDIIISDTNISNQQIAIVPIKTTAGSWAAGSNGYTSDTIGQQLLQTLDIDTLKTNINAQSNVDYKSLSIVGSPAYYDSGNLNTLKTIVKNTSAVNPESKQLTQNVNAGVYTQGLVINPLTGAPWTETDLRAVSVGLESAEAS